MADQIGDIPTINGSSVTFLAVVAAAAVLLLLIVVAWCCCQRRRRRNRLTRASRGNNLSTLHPTPHAAGSGRRAGFAPLGQDDNDDDAFNAAPSPRASHDIEYANPYAPRYAGYDEPGTAPGLGRTAYPPTPAAAPSSQRAHGHRAQQSSYSQPRREEYAAYPPAASHSYAPGGAAYGGGPVPDSTGYVPPPSSGSASMGTDARAARGPGSQVSSPTAASSSAQHMDQHFAHSKASSGAHAYRPSHADGTAASAAPYETHAAAGSSSAPHQPYAAAGASMPAAPYAAGPASPATDAPPPEYDFTTGGSAAAPGDRKQGLH